MDQLHPVEVFRSMLIQKGVISPDGSEKTLSDVLSTDDLTVDYFFRTYFSSPQGWEERTKRSAYSNLERSETFSRDLNILSLWAQRIDTLIKTDGVMTALKVVWTFGFRSFALLSYQEMRESVSFARSKATAPYSSNRQSCGCRSPVHNGRTCYLLQSRTH